MQDVPLGSTAQGSAKRILSATPLFERLSKPSWNKAAAAVPGWVQRNRTPDRKEDGVARNAYAPALFLHRA